MTLDIVDPSIMDGYNFDQSIKMFEERDRDQGVFVIFILEKEWKEKVVVSLFYSLNLFLPLLFPSKIKLTNISQRKAPTKRAPCRREREKESIPKLKESWYLLQYIQ